MGVRVDHQIGPVEFLELLEPFDATAGIYQSGDLVPDEDGVGEWELASFLSRDQVDVRGDFG